MTGKSLGRTLQTVRQVAPPAAVSGTWYCAMPPILSRETNRLVHGEGGQKNKQGVYYRTSVTTAPPAPRACRPRS